MDTLYNLILLSAVDNAIISARLKFTIIRSILAHFKGRY